MEARIIRKGPRRKCSFYFGDADQVHRYSINCNKEDICENVTISGEYALIMWHDNRTGLSLRYEFWRLNVKECVQIPLPTKELYLTEDHGNDAVFLEGTKLQYKI